MADDHDLITEIKDRILERIDLSDKMTEQKLQAVGEQSQRDIQGLRDDHSRDKAEAITRSTNEHKNTREAVSLVGGRVTVLEQIMEEKINPVVVWYHDEGSKLGGRVSTLEQLNVKAQAEKAEADRVRDVADGEKRGSRKTWALIWAAILAAGGMLFEYGGTLLDLIKAKMHG